MLSQPPGQVRRLLLLRRNAVQRGSIDDTSRITVRKLVILVPRPTRLPGSPIGR